MHVCLNFCLEIGGKNTPMEITYILILGRFHHVHKSLNYLLLIQPLDLHEDKQRQIRA